MLRSRVDVDLRVKRARTRRGAAPVPLRVGLIAVLGGALAAVIGGAGGFWLGLPAALLAGSVAATPAGVAACAASVMLVVAAAAALVHGGTLPPLWLAVLVPAACLLVLHGMRSRLRRELDAMQDAAFSDPLTGVANRRLLLSMAEYEIARHHRAQREFAVVMLDLDGFKLLNDRYGHAAGDQMLCDVAVQLTRALRSQDTVARLGGDEFCVIAPETGNPRGLAEKILEAVQAAADGNGQLRTSLGLALFPHDGTTIESLLRVADERLLAAKRRRHGGSQRRAA